MLLLVAALFGGCRSSVNVNSIKSKVLHEYDRYRDQYVKTGPQIYQPPINGHNDGYYNIKSIQSKGVERVYVHMTSSFPAPPFIDRVYIYGITKPFDLTSQSLNSSCEGRRCTYVETAILEVPIYIYKQAIDTGLGLKLSGLGGEAEFIIPAGYFQGMSLSTDGYIYLD